MSLAIVLSRASQGIQAPLITIEVHLANGLPAFNLVGLGDAAVRESKERVRSALLNSGFEFPAKRITVNLAPADLPKDGGRFDLAIAIGIIAASGLLPESALQNTEFVGELALTGQVRSVTACLGFSYACREAGHTAVIPRDNLDEACLVSEAQVIAVDSLSTLFMHLSKQRPMLPSRGRKCSVAPSYAVDMADIKGQSLAKRALEISAAGGHNILFVGPPGTGKTMLAQRLLTILPELTEQQALQSAAIRSVAGYAIDATTWTQRPFRQPHHTSSAVALAGGGSHPKPGEVSLAHQGILFLDELPEFERRVLDVLREPMQSGFVSISRAARQVQYPAQFQLVAAMNPSPTGHLHDGRSTADQITKYLNRLSGPFLDRIDLQVDVPKLSSEMIHQAGLQQQTTSQEVRLRVKKALEVQTKRGGKINAQLTNQEIETHCTLSRDDQLFLQNAVDELGLSMRAYHRTVKVARTIADLQCSANIHREHLCEAMSYRCLDNIIRKLQST